MVERKKTNQAKARKKVRVHMHVVAAVVLTAPFLSVHLGQTVKEEDACGSCCPTIMNSFVHNIWIYVVSIVEVLSRS